MSFDVISLASILEILLAHVNNFMWKFCHSYGGIWFFPLKVLRAEYKNMHCRWFSLYMLLLFAFSPFHSFISVSWEASIYYPLHAGPLSCACSFTDSLHHFDSGDYKLRPLMVHHSEILQACYTSPFSRVFDIHSDSRNVTPTYNEIHLYM
jgi:hypothetical protein